MHRGTCRLRIHPDILSEHKAHLASALDPLRAESASQFRHQRVQGRVGSAWRFRPEGLDQLIVRARPHALQDEVREEQAGLRSCEALLDPLVVDRCGEAAAELNTGLQGPAKVRTSRPWDPSSANRSSEPRARKIPCREDRQLRVRRGHQGRKRRRTRSQGWEARSAKLAPRTRRKDVARGRSRDGRRHLGVA